MNIQLTEEQYNMLLETHHKMTYMGQCDVLRRKSDENEFLWHQMMKHKKKISFKNFINNVDMSPLLDEGETPYGYIKDCIRTDNSTSSYVSSWGDKKVMFLQTAGFEFIFH